MADEVRPEPSSGTGSQRSPRKDRATALFAAHLESNGGRPAEPAFTSLLAEHPDLRAELLELRDGLMLFQSQRAALRAHAARAEQARRRFRRVAGIGIGLAAAAAVVVLSIRFFGGGEPLESEMLADSRSAMPELAAAIVRRGAELLQEAVGESGALDTIAGQGNREDTEQTVVRDTAGFYSLMERVAEGQPEPLRNELRGELELVRESLATTKADGWRARVLETLDRDESAIAPGRAYLHALRADPVLRERIDDLAIDRDSEEEAARLVLLLQGNALLRLRAVDVGEPWREVDGARVFAQSVAVLTQELGPAKELGRTPLALTALEPGDWRITVVDVAGPKPRFSELRLLAQPGEDLGVQFAFLRETSEVVRSMVPLAPCTFSFGVPPIYATPSTKGPLHEECESGEFAIDPCEVTCSEYSRFFRDLVDHRSWFGGELPIARPIVLEEDGSCRAQLARCPIVGVTWYEAMLYANWAGKRLPTEREWERAARGTTVEDRRYPWGDAFASECINVAYSIVSGVREATAQGRIFMTTPPPFETLLGTQVDAPEFEQGATPAISGRRIHRLADNVAEFTEDLYCEAPRGGARSLLDSGGLFRTAKGGSWLIADEERARNWTRAPWTTRLRATFVGFRCVKTPNSGIPMN